MSDMILIRYGEIFLKGQNRPYFENALKRALAASARKYSAVVEKGLGRYYVRRVAPQDMSAALDSFSKIFGVHSVSPAREVDKELSVILEAAAALSGEKYAKLPPGATFKVESKRADKRFPISSMELSSKVGEYILDHVPGLLVDVHNPSFLLHIEIRETAFIYTDTLPARGGMPVGTSGRGLLLLSGGIDSPVAGYMMAKRGVEIEAVHFYSFPYTSERAREKVVSLAKILSEYTGPIRLHLVPFTDIQTAIYEKCPEEQLTILMRIFMMKIGERIARVSECGALITGESLGQVASQTMASISVTNSAVSLPVFRPLIGMDKSEIMERAQQIGTYDTSILPYEDCCTVFVPKHPVTHPVPRKIALSMEQLEAEAMIEKAVAATQSLIASHA